MSSRCPPTTRSIPCTRTLEVAGHQQVGGIDAIKLTSRPNSLFAETIWVAPGTYLPLRAVVSSTPGGPGGQQTANITWLPPTTQNLANLSVLIPAGFRQVTFPEAGQPIMQKLRPGFLPRAAAFCPPPAGASCGYAFSGGPRPFPTLRTKPAS